MSHPSSYLFVPGNRPERFDKALSAGADAVIVDLEDAVPPDAKEAARRALQGWLPHASSQVIVRVNAADTPWFADDLAACVSPNVAAIMLPKADNPSDLAACTRAAPNARLLPLVETAAGFDALRSLTGAPGVERIVFGSIDFQLDLGISGEDEALLFFRSQLVLASRLGGLAAPVDGVTTEIHDAAFVQAEAAKARRLGFGAKLCIHPLQVAPVNAAFRPTPQELDWARRVLAASDQAKGAAAVVDGKMIDRPVVLRAHAILARDK
ncbi:CoA ester lyase [Bordetella sp. LUAb4]|uniref:HpcH/HpaI aldolase/citrate lyase family protein n=1 Tax=Bordetella sp. LUAb4 TaxID=2843195 RepID=UPI001E459F87|nr:CoA ester lyase [Bordetella sp. LUAb4]